jgi:NADH-quinone oxidoreductase subunit M
MRAEISYAQQIGFPILSLLILLPIALAVTLAALPSPRRAYPIAAAGAGVELALTALLFWRFHRGAPEAQFVERIPLGLGVSYHLGVDGISVLFVPLIALLTLLVALYARQVDKASPGGYLAALFGIEAALIGAFVSLDLVIFWLFSTLELLPSALLIRRWGVGSRRRAARRSYVAFGLMSSALLLAGFALLGRHGVGGRASFDLLALGAAPPPAGEQAAIFALLSLGLAVRAPLFPFHGWLPAVMEEGPIAGVNVFLAGVKLGAYGFLRFVIPLVPAAAGRWSWIVTVVGVAGILYGALLALVQVNLRRLLAYACVSQMGCVMVGLFSLNLDGIEGGLAATLNMGVAAAALYFIAAFLHARLGSAKLTRLGGLSQYVPLLTLAFLVVALATIGMPMTSGFDAEHHLLLGALDADHVPLAVGAATGSLLAAAYLFRYYQHAFLGPARGAPAPEARVPDLRARELVIAGSLSCFLIGFGLFSAPLFGTMAGSLKVLTDQIRRTGGVASVVDQRARPEPPL